MVTKLKKGFGPAGCPFLIAEACIIAGAAKNAYHTKYRGAVYAQNWSCESLRKGVFIAGAVFVVFTMILNVYYYMYFKQGHKARLLTKAIMQIRLLEWHVIHEFHFWVLLCCFFCASWEY
ncbi:hypothetical protein QJS04_geneDACA003021 [Acorus gramineus]|uniref:Uncharacterized protein n=1 Tax=Acorus gramineus TaxID=55184 RepID=A0AAV9BW64_ACOGR|nr:hypothetical protein QJS04_geneDACA003021 [Acorus gramineus]